jgi:hypothetical protein
LQTARTDSVPAGSWYQVHTKPTKPDTTAQDKLAGCTEKSAQLAVENARLTQELLDIKHPGQPYGKAKERGPRMIVPVDPRGQKLIECVLAEIRAVQRCEIWFRDETVKSVFDQKMKQCEEQHSFFEKAGDCPRLAP